MSKHKGLFLIVLGLSVVSAIWIADGFKNDQAKQNSSWRAFAYNEQVTKCMDSYGVAHVYDYYKMVDKTDAEVAVIVKTSEVNVGGCR